MKSFLLLGLFALPLWAAQSIETLLKDYRPGKHLSWNRYEKLAAKAHTAWLENKNVEKSFRELNAAIEKEALLAYLTLLTHPKAVTFLGGFDAPSKKGKRQSLDGLEHLRFVRQIEIGGRLISGIESRKYDIDGEQFELPSGPDILRVRIELSPFQRARDLSQTPKGMAGFSWLVKYDEDNTLQVYSEPYVTDTPAHEKRTGHGKTRFSAVDSCGFATHCIACHHRQSRSFYSKDYWKKDVRKGEGYIAFIDYLQNELKLTHEVSTATKLLRDVHKASKPKALQKAMELRLQQLLKEKTP